MDETSALKKGDFRIDPIFIFVLGAIVLVIILLFFIPSFSELTKMLLNTIGKVIVDLLKT